MKILLTLKWLSRSWPILLPVIFMGIHLFIIPQLNFEMTKINKLISLALQIVGGILVLYSIDSNLGVIKKDSISNVVMNWFKAFPLFSKPVNAELGTINNRATMHAVKIRMGGPGRKTKEQLDYLQKQIDWLKEDLQEHFNDVKQRIAESDKKSSNELADLRSDMGLMNNQLRAISVDGLGLQIFGLILMIYGSVVGYFT